MDIQCKVRAKLRVIRLVLVFSSRHDFVLSNLCRLYCYNLNNSINSFFQQNKFYCFKLLTICLLEKYFFSWKIIKKIALRVFEFTTCLFCKLINLRLPSKWPPPQKSPDDRMTDKKYSRGAHFTSPSIHQNYLSRQLFTPSDAKRENLPPFSKSILCQS